MKKLILTLIFALSIFSQQSNAYPSDSFFDVFVEVNGVAFDGLHTPLVVDSFFDVFFDITVTDIDMEDSFFDIFFDITWVDSGERFTTDSFFDIFVNIQLPKLIKDVQPVSEPNALIIALLGFVSLTLMRRKQIPAQIVLD